MLFISCAPTDHDALDALRTALKPVCVLRNLQLCDAYSLQAGTDVSSQLQLFLQQAEIILLVLTPEYLADEERAREYESAMEQRQKRAAHIIPIKWKSIAESALPSELRALQSLPRNLDSLHAVDDREKLMAEIVDEIADYLDAQPASAEQIRQVVWPPPELPALSAAQYTALHSAALSAIDQLDKLGAALHLESATARAAALRQSLLCHLYRVVVTGKSRAGKSTLLNALLGRTICPSKRRLTTAVPIVIGPGAEEQAVILYQDDTNFRLRGPLSAADLQPFADQDRNPVNEKQIKEIRVELADTVLAMGVSYTDIPGFDDPSKEISASAWEIIEAAHGLIFVIDISTYANGGFVLDRGTLDFLKQGIERGRRIILVGNKVDALPAEHRANYQKELAEEIGIRCRQAGLEMPQLFFLSATQANDRRAEKQLVPEPFAAFYDGLWRHLWNTQGIGLRRLYQVFGQLQIGSEEVMALFAVRAKKEDERAQLRIALTKCRDDCRSSQEQCKAGFATDRVRLRQLLAGAQASLKQQFDACISALPDDQKLPRVGDVVKRLESLIRAQDEQLVAQVAHLMSSRLDKLNREMEARLAALRQETGFADALKQSQYSLLALPGWQHHLQRPVVENWVGDAIKFAAGAAALAVGIGTWAIVPPGLGFLFGGVTGWLTNWLGERFLARPRSRQELSAQCADAIAEHLAQLNSELERHHDLVATDLDVQIQNEMSPFMRDLRRRLEDIRPPTEEEKQLHADFDDRSQNALRQLALTLKISSS